VATSVSELLYPCYFKQRGWTVIRLGQENDRADWLERMSLIGTRIDEDGWVREAWSDDGENMAVSVHPRSTSITGPQYVGWASEHGVDDDAGTGHDDKSVERVLM